jgi:hypothetical protein
MTAHRDREAMMVVRKQSTRTSIAISSVGVLVMIMALLTVPGVRAHDDDMTDAGYGHVAATTSADGTVSLELRITEADDCSKFRVIDIVGERDQTSVGGDLEQTDSCLFGGSIVLPEHGRWTLTAWLSFDGHPAGIQLPVNVSDEPATFERAEWLHVEDSIASESSGRGWYWPAGALTLAAIGLLLGAVVVVARRRSAT